MKFAIAGVGNCASALLQGIAYYRSGGSQDTGGLMHPTIGGVNVADLSCVAAFDIDARKVGLPLSQAIHSPPNNAALLYSGDTLFPAIVQRGPTLDGFADHLHAYPPEKRIVISDREPVDIIENLRRAEAEVLVCYMPVGAEQAAKFYADAALTAGVAFVNCVPVFIASDTIWANRFRAAGLPIVGDDIKSQVGATIVHRSLAQLFDDRGCVIDQTYQINVGGNLDFLNMLSRERLASKKASKTGAVQSVLREPLGSDEVHVGPSDYIPWLKDRKVAFIRLEGTGFAGAPLEVEVRLSVEDSPNSAGVAVDAIRCAGIARRIGISGPLEAVCAYTMKRPPTHMPDYEAKIALDQFIQHFGNCT